MDLVSQRYRDVVAKWRARHIDSGEALAEALASYRVRFAFNSGRIENEAITYHDTRDVFDGGRVLNFTGDVRTLFEIQNLKECHERMLEAYGVREPLDEGLVLEFHRVLTQGTYDERRWALGERPGAYKLHDYVVGATGTGAAAADAPDAVRSLLAELDVADADNILTTVAYFHLSFEAIHPFADGNGRCGRELMNYLFVLHDHPPVIVFDEDKLAYYGAMEAWDAEGDLEPMKSFLKAETVRTWL